MASESLEFQAAGAPAMASVAAWIGMCRYGAAGGVAAKETLPF